MLEAELQQSADGSAALPAGALDEAQLEQPGAAMAAQAEHARRRARELREQAEEAHERARAVVVQTRRSASRRCYLLREDPDLGRHIPHEQLADALEHCVAATVTLPKGGWSPRPPNVCAGGIGLLVLEGLIVRRVDVDGRYGAELLGPGDLLRPWDPAGQDSLLRTSTQWQLLEPARLAVLDRRAAERLGRFPTVGSALAARGLARAGALMTMMAIVHQPRTELRVQMLFWHLASRWGRVRADGVLLPLPLSHSTIADLVAAQRPSVTGALKKLSARDAIGRVPEGWLLRARPPWARRSDWDQE